MCCKPARARQSSQTWSRKQQQKKVRGRISQLKQLGQQQKQCRMKIGSVIRLKDPRPRVAFVQIRALV